MHDNSRTSETVDPLLRAAFKRGGYASFELRAENSEKSPLLMTPGVRSQIENRVKMGSEVVVHRRRDFCGGPTTIVGEVSLYLDQRVGRTRLPSGVLNEDPSFRVL